MQQCYSTNHVCQNPVLVIFQDVIEGLESIGHVTEMFGVGGSVVCGVARQDGKLHANSDFRKAGEVDGI